MGTSARTPAGRSLKAVATGVAMSGVAGGVLLLTALPAAAVPQDHTRICHATGSDRNPYVVIEPANPGVENGHRGHQDGRDQIPTDAERGPTFRTGEECEQATPPTHEPPKENGKPPAVVDTPAVAQQQPRHAPVPQTRTAPTSRPIPAAVSAGAQATADWQVPAGGALIVLGAAGAAAALARRASAGD